MEEKNRSQSKYFNTARRMDEALLALLEKKDFAYINIREICALAEVNRSTFYLHYENTWDLLQESLEYMHGEFLSCFRQENMGIIEKLQTCPKEEMVFITPEYLLPYLTFIKEHQRLFRATMERPGSFSTQETYNKMFRYIFSPILERFEVPEVERPYRMDFYVKGIAGVVERWLEDNCRLPVEDVSTLIQNCVLPGQTLKSL